jgi:cyclic pyranopterin phosphate synthase
MPREFFGADYQFLPRSELLTFEEITRLAGIFTGLGARKVRLTGGEPLLRHDLPRLVAMLAAVTGIEDLSLTTNGALLERDAAALAEAGLRRVTVSLDSLDDATFAANNDSSVPVAQVLAGIEAAAAVGLTPVKVNVVVRRGINDGEVIALARRFKGTGHIVRFIEYMDVGHSNGWRLEQVVPAAEVVAAIGAEMPLEPIPPNYPGEVARRFRYRDGSGEIGVVGSVTLPFCGDCHRARVSADGKLFTCLFATAGHDLRALLRNGATDAAVAAALTAIWEGRADRYSEVRSADTAGLPRVEMSYIGG